MQALTAEKYQQKKIFNSGAIGEILSEERIRDLIDSLLEKNVDGVLVKTAKTVFSKIK